MQTQSSAAILSFPAQTTCSSCGRVVGPDELSECYRCHKTFCGKVGCASTCDCDRLADWLIEKMADRLASRSIDASGTQS